MPIMWEMWWKFFLKEFFETTMEISVENCHLQLGIFCNSLSPLGDTMTQQNTAVVFFQLLRFSNMDKTFFVDDAVSYKKSSTRTYQAPLHPNYFQNSNFETIATYPREHVCSLHLLNSLTLELEFVGCYKYGRGKVRLIRFSNQRKFLNFERKTTPHKWKLLDIVWEKKLWIAHITIMVRKNG